MKGKIFLDTNILIYAHDLDAGPKHRIAAAIIKDSWEKENGVLSAQVLQEFYVNVTRKISNPIAPAKARGIVKNYLSWHVEQNSPEMVLLASEFEERHQLSFWDSMILAAASNARVEKIITEDLNHGQIMEGIIIENPFMSIDLRPVFSSD